MCSDASCQQLQLRGPGAGHMCDVPDDQPAVLMHKGLECLNLCHHARPHSGCTNQTVITVYQRTWWSHNSVHVCTGYIHSWSHACNSISLSTVLCGTASAMALYTALQSQNSAWQRHAGRSRSSGPPLGLVEIGLALTPKCGAVDRQAM